MPVTVIELPVVELKLTMPVGETLHVALTAEVVPSENVPIAVNVTGVFLLSVQLRETVQFCSWEGS